MDTFPTARSAVRGRAPAAPLDRLWIFAYFLVTLAMWAGLLAPAQILLPDQIERLDPAHKVWMLGLVTALGAGTAVVSSPVVGALSDRTASRLGRRRPWVLASGAVCSAALLALPLQTTLIGVGVCWCLLHGAVNAMSAALCAVIPDRVPVARRGTVAGVAGLAMPLGLVAGTMLVSGVPTWAGYVIMAGLVPLLMLPYLLLNEDAATDPAGGGPPDGAVVRPPRRTPLAFAKDMYVAPRRHPDFAWAWSGRFFAQLATGMATLYLIYFLRDEVRTADPAGGVVVLSLLYTVGVVAACLVAGRMSDRTGRRKPFVIVSSVLMAGALICMAVFPLWSAAMAAAAVLGAGYGVYLAIDQALVTQILPRETDRAKDLGLINAAGSGAVAIAPLLAGRTLLFGGYSALFTVAALMAIASGLFIQPIKSVR